MDAWARELAKRVEPVTTPAMIAVATVFVCALLARYNADMSRYWIVAIVAVVLMAVAHWIGIAGARASRSVEVDARYLDLLGDDIYRRMEVSLRKKVQDVDDENAEGYEINYDRAIMEMIVSLDEIELEAVNRNTRVKSVIQKSIGRNRNRVRRLLAERRSVEPTWKRYAKEWLEQWMDAERLVGADYFDE